jgi:hypothetical protein
MTDMKKCGAFLVKIDFVDRKDVIIRERPSDALVLSLFDLVPHLSDGSHFRFVCKNSSVILSFFENEPGHWVIDGWTQYPRRFTKRAPHKLLKRAVSEVHEYQVVKSTEEVGKLIAQLASLRNE